MRETSLESSSAEIIAGVLWKVEISHTNILIDKGEFSDSQEWEQLRSQIIQSVQDVHWPPKNDEFTILPEENANGVSPITEQFEANLDSKQGWNSTGRKHFKSVLSEQDMLDDVIDKLSRYYDNPKDIISSPWFDGSKKVRTKRKEYFTAVEWETGNISSSHRSLNRIALGLVAGIITAGVVVLPTRNLYEYLTDRVGNYAELEPYFLIWRLLESEVDNGVIEVIAVEQDDTGDVPAVGKLTDGLSDRDESELANQDLSNDEDTQSGLSDYDQNG